MMIPTTTRAIGGIIRLLFSYNPPEEINQSAGKNFTWPIPGREIAPEPNTSLTTDTAKGSKRIPLRYQLHQEQKVLAVWLEQMPQDVP